MPKTGLSKEEIIECAASLANEKGLSYLSVTTEVVPLGYTGNPKGYEAVAKIASEL